MSSGPTTARGRLVRSLVIGVATGALALAMVGRADGSATTLPSDAPMGQPTSHASSPHASSPHASSPAAAARKLPQKSRPSLPALPEVSAEAYVIADLDTGAILAWHNPHLRLRPASTLKTLTALTLLPRLDPDGVRPDGTYTATRADEIVEGTAVGLRAGYRYTLDQLFYGMFLPSANDCANALARANGGIDLTIDMMNAEARHLGAHDTLAATPNGLEPDDGSPQHISAYDLALFARAGMQRADFRRYVGTRTYDFPDGTGHNFAIRNTNRLLGAYDGMIGVKTGYTSKALNTMVGAAERDGHRIVASELHVGSGTYPQMAQLLSWGFEAVGKARPLGYLTLPNERPTTGKPPMLAVTGPLGPRVL